MIRAVYIGFMLTIIPSPLISGETALFELQEKALAGNPKLRAALHETSMMKKRIPQSFNLDDPKLTFALNNIPTDNFSLSKDEMTSKEIGVSQMFPLGARFYIQKKIALKEYDKAAQNFRMEKIEILRMLRESAYGLASARASQVILQNMKEQLKLVIDNEVAAHKAGRGSLSNVIKATIEYTAIDEEIFELTQKERELEQSINALTGAQTVFTLRELPDPKFLLIDRKSVISQVRQSNPELAIMKIETDVSREQVRLKTQEYVPEMELGISYMQRDNGPMGRRSDMITGMMTFNIPLWFWFKNKPMVDEMKIGGEAAAGRYQNKQNEINARAETLLAKIEKTKELFNLYRDRLIPQTELALETVLARYRTSSIEFMPVIDTARMLLDLRKKLIAVKEEYYMSFSALHSLMGNEVLP